VSGLPLIPRLRLCARRSGLPVCAHARPRRPSDDASGPALWIMCMLDCLLRRAWNADRPAGGFFGHPPAVPFWAGPWHRVWPKPKRAQSGTVSAAEPVSQPGGRQILLGYRANGHRLRSACTAGAQDRAPVINRPWRLQDYGQGVQYDSVWHGREDTRQAVCFVRHAAFIFIWSIL